MITCQLIGGLGNQLFQIASTLSVAWNNQDVALFDLDAHIQLSQGMPARSYKNTVYRNLVTGVMPQPKFVYIEVNSPEADVKIPYHPGMELRGFFQSERYFNNYRQRLLDLFTPTEKALAIASYKYPDIKQCCAIHVRRGDRQNRPRTNPILPIEYYRKAIAQFESDRKFLVFSDDPHWCEQAFDDRDRFTIVANADYIDLYLMGMCEHQIIANSTFSWWGAYLNQNIDKITITPQSLDNKF